MNLQTGPGLDAALEKVDALIDVTNVDTMRAKPAIEFFGHDDVNLLAAAARAGVGHVVALSIVGVDRVELGYYLGKRRQEELLLAAGVPVPTSVLRATQFHEFAGQVLSRMSGPVAVIPTMRSQPVAAREVGVALAELAAGPAVGLAPELAGPQPETVADMARRQLHALGARRRVVEVRMPGRAGRAAAEGALLPTGDGPRGVQTFDEWLASPDAPARSR